MTDDEIADKALTGCGFVVVVALALWVVIAWVLATLLWGYR